VIDGSYGPTCGIENPNQTCPLCISIEGKSDFEFDYPWIRNVHESVLPALGHLRRGHMLVCTNHHIDSLGAADPEIGEAIVESVSATCRKLAEATDEEVFVFEHGFRKNSNSPVDCSVSHVHIHLLPLPSEIASYVRELIAEFKHISVVDLHSEIRSRDDYLLATFSPEIAWFVSPEGFQIQRRHFLKAIDRALGGHQNWDEVMTDSRDEIAATHREMFPDAAVRRRLNPK
jgi:diadenosine tetraphosphate (Ap4A) HIT family hydrolase